MNEGRLNDRVALVTGAGSGIGRAIAESLAADGAQVVATDIDPALANVTAKSIDGAVGFELDVTSAVSAQAVISRVETEIGPIDILVNNAGVSTMAPIWELSERDWDFNFDVNAKGVFLVTRAALPGMMERRSGSIVNTASMAGKKGVPLLAHYAASKWACIGFTLSAAVELGPFGIRINCVCPGYVATSMQDRELVWESAARNLTADQVSAEYIAKTPLGRMQTAEDVARVVVYLASDDAEFLTGAAIDITGGSHLT